MLEIRPNCEYCDKDLPVESKEACICSYECTFCRTCVDEIFENVCPNCGGGFVPRPIRPKTIHRKGTSRQFQPASEKRIHTPYTESEIKQFIQAIKQIPPEQR